MKSVFFVGSTSNPITGATIMARTLVGSKNIKIAFNLSVLDTSYIDNLIGMGNLSFRKAIKALRYLFVFIYRLTTQKIEIVILNPSSLGLALIKDCIYILLAGKLFNKKVILWMHGNGILDYDQRHKLSRKFIDLSLKTSTCIVIPGESLVDSFSYWLPPEKIKVIPHGLNPSMGNNFPLLRKNKRINVLFFSNLFIEKGWLVTLNAAISILKKREDFYFVFCGAWSSEEDKILANNLVTENNISEYVVFKGKILGKDKINIFKDSDIFVFPTYFKIETFGIVNLEALEAGLPIITTRRAAIPEIVEDGINGFLIPEKDPTALAEKIIYLADHPEIRHEIGQNNRKKFQEQYTVEKFSKKWIDLINNVTD